MPHIEWDESFSVGDAEIDRQHKTWLGIFNKMHNFLIKKDIESSRRTALDSLQAMQDYAKDHFSFEEEYMRKINYPDLLEHRRIHKNFDNRIYQYYREALEGRLVLNTEIIKIIRNWLLEHILVEDKKYNLFAIQQKSLKADDTNTQ